MKSIIISLNSVIDIHHYFDNFTLNEENFIKKTEVFAAGKGVNVAKVLNLLSAPFKLVTLLGNKNAKYFKELLNDFNIKSEIVITKGKIRENISLHSPEIYETRICTNSFYATTDVCISTIKKAFNFAEKNDVVVFSGRIPAGADKEVIIRELSEFKSKDIFFIIDSVSFNLSDYKILTPYIIKPNEEEIKNYGTTENAAVLNLLNNGVSNVVLSKGEKGIKFCSFDRCFEIIPPKIEVKSTVGAGDSTVAGFSYGIINNMSIEDLCLFAVSCGTASCLTNGGYPPQYDDLERIYNILKIEECAPLL